MISGSFHNSHPHVILVGLHLRGLCPLLRLAHNRHSTNICSMNGTARERKGHQASEGASEGAVLGGDPAVTNC